MVKQEDIIKLDLDLTKGHEQAGYRPALVVSNASFSRAS
ncbi:MAG: type II toxin-antitoxin system PemK/MazF family toxin, partial [Firmicutes bacterium]|nr:type II toxin-antitoxin system PemK/MazF family toxin [Bacillota bacterium]